MVSAATGCGTVALTLPSPIVLTPSTSRLQIGDRIHLRAVGPDSVSNCVWNSSEPSILTSLGEGFFRGVANGQALASATCGNAQPALAQIEVSSTPQGPLVITQGGTYSGEWTSNDPNTPAVTIKTNEKVVLSDSVITGRGDLIYIPSTVDKAHVVVHDVTGMALDPGVPGVQRGSFLSASNVGSLRVRHCTMLGVSFGVKVLDSTPEEIVITENLGSNLEDRASDGQGSVLPLRPQLGHFIFLNQVTSPNGAEIGWNQLRNTIGQSSIEDVINLYKSQGTATAPLHVHDNFLEGFSSTTTPSYTGTGVIADGDAHEPVTAYVLIENNQIIHAAGSGIEVAVGHDITVAHNKIVSCGLDASGAWYAMPFADAVVVWNYYAAPMFFNHSVTATEGGLLRPSGEGTPEIANLWARGGDLGPTDTLTPNTFSNPCLVKGQLNLGAEDIERAAWLKKLNDANLIVGDRHTQ